MIDFHSSQEDGGPRHRRVWPCLPASGVEECEPAKPIRTAQDRPARCGSVEADMCEGDCNQTYLTFRQGKCTTMPPPYYPQRQRTSLRA